MIVVSGEALMDVFPAASTATGVMLDARIGGSPLNVAIGLARLAQPVAFFGAVGSGSLGERLMQALHDEGVHTGCTARLEAPVTLSLVDLDARGVPHYAFMGTGAADRLLPLEALAAVPRAYAYQFGSYAMVVEPVAGTQRALVEREWQRSVVAYDPNVRLNVEPDVQRWRDTLDWMLPRTTLLKISDEDFGLLYPRPQRGRDRAPVAGRRRRGGRRHRRRRRRLGLDAAGRAARAAGACGGGRYRGRRRHLPGRAAHGAGRAWASDP